MRTFESKIMADRPKSFVIKLDGTKGDDGTNWNTNYEQA